MIIDFTIEDLLLDSYLQKNFHTPELVEKLRELQLGVAPVNDYVIDDAWFLSI